MFCKSKISIKTIYKTQHRQKNGFFDGVVKIVIKFVAMQKNKPFNNLLKLPPQEKLETEAILRKCISVSRQLAKIDEASIMQIPNEDVFINSIPMLEAHASSAIENIVTTKDELFRQPNENNASVSPAAKEALRYRTALRQGFDTLGEKPLCLNTAIEICSTIKGEDMSLRRIPGTQLQNGVGEVVYTPPEPHILPDLLSNWEKFMHEKDNLDPLVRMAVGHYQFEAIHPFADGNGRTGRILNVLFLVEQGLLHSPILYLSRPILEKRISYYQLLSGVTYRQEWEAWILFMLSAVEDAATWTLRRIDTIIGLFEHTRHYIAHSVQARIPIDKLLRVLFMQPYCRLTHVMEVARVGYATAKKYLRLLCKIGVLREEKYGREKFFAHEKYLRLMTGDEHDFESYPPVKE